MNRLLLIIYRLAFWSSLPVYLLCSASSYLPPSYCFFTDALALAFPFVLGVLLLLLVITLFVQRRRSWLIVLLLLAGYRNIGNSIAFHPFASQQTTADSSTLKVLTWNVFFFLNDHSFKHDTVGNPRYQMIRLIGRENADVVCFQEFMSISGSTRYLSIHHILDSMGYKYRMFGKDKEFPYDQKSFSEYGTVLYSKYPILDSGRIWLEGENAVYADIMFQQRKVRIYTAHLSSLGIYSDTAHTEAGRENVYQLTYQRKGSVARKIKRIALQHEKEVAILDSAFKSSTTPLIFCADMNSVPASYTYSKLRSSHHLQDAFLQKGFGLGQTYYGLSPTLRIDVCLADKRLAVTGCHVDYEHLSDHYPVISTFRWKE